MWKTIPGEPLDLTSNNYNTSFNKNECYKSKNVVPENGTFQTWSVSNPNESGNQPMTGEGNRRATTQIKQEYKLSKATKP